MELVPFDKDSVEQADYVLSIVPLTCAGAAASRVRDAMKLSDRNKEHPLYFLDLNAVSPMTAEKNVAEFGGEGSHPRILDG